MKSGRFLIALVALSLGATSLSAARFQGGRSVYTQQPQDEGAVFFTPGEFHFTNDGKSDVSDALQKAIDRVKAEQNFGILFIPEGEYRISRTITIPNAVRIIGYGAKRPVFYLAKDTPGFQGTEPAYMFWFTGSANMEGRQPQDAGAGTFYSAFSNVDFRIGPGNPAAVAVRSHFAQHSFISHCDFFTGDGYAGIDEVGNESEDLRFHGGTYGIVSGRTSPGWPMMLVDTYFEGQKKAAIYSKEVGMAIVGMHVRNTPVAFEMHDGLQDRLYMEKILLENVSDAAVKVSLEENTFSQVNMNDVECRNVPVLVAFKQSGKTVQGPSKTYHVDRYTYGLCLDGIGTDPVFDEKVSFSPAAGWKALQPDLPQLPSMDRWVSVKTFGAVGDGEADDTEAFEKAIASQEVVYVPTGWYRLTRPLKMKEGTKLIGLHPYATQFVLKESEPSFSGFGGPVPIVETFPGGDNILNGIGIFGGAYNYRAVGCKWTAGASSYLNDVKFVGGHGTMARPSASREAGRRGRTYQRPVSSPTAPVYAQGKDLAWDSQYWSLWIADNGGGTIKDIWTADTYAAAGLCMTETDTPGRIYAMSLEHHVRTEMRLSDVSNWKFYAVQFEEEGIEGPDCHNVDMSRCRNLQFNNVWMYRVIRAFMPKEIGFRVWDSRDITVRNMHSYTQIIPVIGFPVYDMNKAVPVPAWDFSLLHITGDEPSRRTRPGVFEPALVVTGFEMPSGATADSKGNVYFCENRLRKIYRWDARTEKVSLVCDFPWKPFALGTDTEDRLLVIARYDPQPGYLVDGKQETVIPLPDDNPMYSGWGNGGWEVRAYAVDPEHPEKTFSVLPLKPSGDQKGARRVWHPSSRWRSDFLPVATAMPQYSFVAPDGVTVIPQTFDLFRCSALTAVQPGQAKPAYIANEMDKTTVRFDVNPDGTLREGRIFCPFSQYSQTVAPDGTVWIADGDILAYGPDGTLKRRISVPERPVSLTFGGAGGEFLLITTSRSLYAMRVR